MRVLSINSSAPLNSCSNSSFKANVVVTREAVSHACNHISKNPNMAYLLLYDSIHKLNKRVQNQQPFGTTFTLDKIKKAGRISPVGKESNFEMRVGDKSVDYYFDFENILHNPAYAGKSEKERIDLESTKQSDYLYNTYQYLKSQLKF